MKLSEKERGFIGKRKEDASNVYQRNNRENERKLQINLTTFTISFIYRF